MAVENQDFGMKCIKYMLCVANLMFVIVGLLLISIGYTIRTIYTNFDQFMNADYYNPSTLAICIGFFILVIAMFGFIGAWKESTLLVNTYAFCLTIILVLELSVTIATYAMRVNIQGSIENNMRSAMVNFNMEINAYTWNVTQYNLECCGIRNNSDWNKYVDRNFGLQTITLDDNVTLHVPPTCCWKEQCTSATVYKQGCLYRLTSIVSQCALLLGVGALCVSFIQVLGIVFASLLAKSIRKLKTQRLVAREQRRRHFHEQMVKAQEKEMKKYESPNLYTPMDSEA